MNITAEMYRRFRASARRIEKVDGYDNPVLAFGHGDLEFYIEILGDGQYMMTFGNESIMDSDLDMLVAALLDNAVVFGYEPPQGEE